MRATGDTSAAHLLGTGGRCLLQALLDRFELRIDVAVATDPTGIEHAHSRDGLESLVRLCRGEGIAAPTADAEKRQTYRVDARKTGDEVSHAVDVLDPVSGLIHVARLAAASALIRCVRGYRDVALFRQALRIQSRDLLFYPAIWVRHNNRRIPLLRIVVCGAALFSPSGRREFLCAHQAYATRRHPLREARQDSPRLRYSRDGAGLASLRGLKTRPIEVQIPVRPLLRKCIYRGVYSNDLISQRARLLRSQAS